MLSYTIIENFLPQSTQDALETYFQYGCKWNYVSETSGVDGDLAKDKKDPLELECPQLVHQAIYMGVPEETYDLCSIVLRFLESITGCTVGDIEKIKVNMNLQNILFAGGKYHPPHADMLSEDYFTVIYYIKDSDGPTRFFNKKTTDPFPYKDLVEIGNVEPKKGRAVLFKSNQLHTGTCPVETENRLAINFIFKAKNLKLDFQPQNSLSIGYIK